MKVPRNVSVISAAALFSFTLPGKAEIETVMLQLYDTEQTDVYIGKTYTVPTGKTLLIEYILFEPAFENSGADRTYELVNGSRVLYRETASDNRVSFDRPLRLREGRSIRNPNSTSTSFGMNIVGLLVDNQDLYANAPTPTTNLASADGADGEVSGTVSLSDPRPVSLGIEKSRDLENWVDAPDIAISSTESPTQKVFQGPTAVDDERLFLRAVVRSRSDLLALDF